MIHATRARTAAIADIVRKAAGLAASADNHVKDWELVPTNSAKPIGVWAGSQPSIPKGELSGLLVHIVATGNGTRYAKLVGGKGNQQAGQAA